MSEPENSAVTKNEPEQQLQQNPNQNEEAVDADEESNADMEKVKIDRGAVAGHTVDSIGSEKQIDQQKKIVQDGIEKLNKGVKRSSTGGLASLVGSLSTTKRVKKQSVLDKSAQDWRQYVQKEDLEEELSGHLRSKNSYLDRQDFLLRADYSKFERERDLRAQERKTGQQSTAKRHD